MTTRREHPIQFVRGGDWANRNEASLLHPGELGQAAVIGDKHYKTVQLDTGATSATPTGAQATQQVAFWKDRANSLVTNDIRFSQGGRNTVAGIFPCTVTAGYYTAILTGRSRRVSVKVESDTYVAGDQVIAASGATATGDREAAGTAPTYQRIGFSNYGNHTANVLLVDLDLPDYD